jgi:hypothetical protein
MIVGFLALRFPGKTYVLCVIDISLCALWLSSWFNFFHNNNSRINYVFNKWQKLLDQENHKNALICIKISSWYSRKQIFVALSSVEAEYMAASQAACEAIWMRKILVGLFGSHLDPTVIYCDNQSCIKLSINPVFHDRSKHIDIRYHHLRDCVHQNIMLLQYIPREDQDADILMKALTRSKFEYHRDRIGVKDNPFLVEREC